MEKLYTDLAEVYEAMYKTFINYHDEYNFYNKIIKRFNATHLLEIGSGTGNLASYFIKNGVTYSGLDYSKEMISIAQKKVPNGKFIKGDMRSFHLKQPVQAIIMTGRTISYLLPNIDVKSTFNTIYENLKEQGIFCFDFIDARAFIPEISKEKKVIHTAMYNGTKYCRESIWNLNLKYGMDFLWYSKYFKEVENEWIEIGKDTSIIRAFSKEEIEIFLTITGFEIKDIIKKESYAFPTYVVIAQKP
ncbi:class I SAM-dependent DNA methyltransferase [Aquimarina aggregata]|uniref:class I SAM-dependent DNA methyltransferase n=1 Tax=Aquimarina aggregata TaxID=1642818 RepID=UPI002492407A|nr:class I SAM-dependent methyltransferase [Aquimarina aggregata]